MMPNIKFIQADHGDADAIVYISMPNQKCLPKTLEMYTKILSNYIATNKAAEEEVGLIVVNPDQVGGDVAKKSKVKMIIISPTGPLDRDYDDATRFKDAAYNGLKKAIKVGSKKPLLCIPLIEDSSWPKTISLNLSQPVTPMVKATSMLASLEAIYTPIEIREDVPRRGKKVDEILFDDTFSGDKFSLFHAISAIESGRCVARDIGGSDPERMSAPRVADYVQQTFSGTCIKVDVVSDPQTIRKEYPCLAAVTRGSAEKHQARVIFMTYEPDGQVERTLVFVGKGVTYDTGGHDIKAGGVMAGMHRDKCGSAAVAGLLKTVSILKPKGNKVIGAMSMVRNSIGPDAYVSDELITARSGSRLRIGNTDAEGRMAMVDVLCHLKEMIIQEKAPSPHFFTIATLTGHACIAAGGNYSIIIDNGPARATNTAKRIQNAGDGVGDMFEISTVRREDYDFNKGPSEYEDILQANNAPSSRTPRGHQIPAAFLTVVSGLDNHGLDSNIPLAYSHIDIASSSGPFPGIPSGAPIAALSMAYFL